MAYEFKKLSDVNVIEAMKDGLNVLVEDGGEIVKLAANSMIPEDVALKSDIPTGVVKSVNGEVPDEAGNVKVSGLPDGSAAHQQLVTDGEGKAKWEDKAFGEKKIEIILTFDPDVNTETYGPLRKVCENALPLSGILGARVKILYNGVEHDTVVNESNVTAGDGYYTVAVSDDQVLAQFTSIHEAQTEDNFGMDVPVGVYVAYSNTGPYVAEINSTDVIVKPLDAKFLPEGVSALHVTFTMNSDTTAVADVDVSTIASALHNGRYVYATMVGDGIYVFTPTAYVPDGLFDGVSAFASFGMQFVRNSSLVAFTATMQDGTNVEIAYETHSLGGDS